MWELLPERKQIGAGWRPAFPLILAAWDEAPALLKMLRLAEHIEWAEAHDALARVATFLRALREEDWHHTPEH